MDENSPILLVGLGNPGKEYEKTRHNIGAEALKTFAQEEGVSLKAVAKLEGSVGTGVVGGKKVIFLIPATYMNLSGRAVSKCMSYYKVPASNILVLVDDTYIPFADVRLKKSGGSAGHNGLKDIAHTLGSTDYARLRIGIGEKQTEDLSDFVLQIFTKQEQDRMDTIFDRCIHEIKTKFISAAELLADKKKEDLRSN